MKKCLSPFILGIVCLSGCARVPIDLMQPEKSTLVIRSAQSRSFDVQSDKRLLQASLSVLQDMGYTIKESSSEYGVLTAEKEASAISAGQVVGAIAIAVLSGQAIPVDRTQQITATMVVLDKDQESRAVARTVFQRVVTRTDNTQYYENITDQNVYKEFYEKLDKALFLEVNNV